MVFSNREIDVVNFDKLDGFQLKFASGTSLFSGETVPLPERIDERDSIWSGLGEENYELIGNTLFNIETVERKRDILSDISPRLHMALTLPAKYDERSYVVLILDNDQVSLVDWVLASPFPTTNYFPQIDALQPTFYFDIPLIPVTREESFPGDSKDFLSKISQWGQGQKLTFAIFAIENEEFSHGYYHFWKSYNHPFVLPYLFDFADFIAKKADRHLKSATNGDEMLQIITENGDTREATSEELQNLNGKALLLCHGILSSTKDAFAQILKDPTFLGHMLLKYNGVMAWDHYTLSKTTSQNADDLICNLRDLHNVTLDIVCHSRGAGVIRNFVECPVIVEQLATNGVKINKVIFVAGACLGSQLAEPRNTNRMFRRMNMLVWCFGKASVGFLRAILTVIKLLAMVAQKMPGVESMNPAGRDIAELNKYGSTLAAEYHYISANYDLRFLPGKLLEEFLWDSGVFDGAANDLVVPYEGATPSGKYLANYQGKMSSALSYGEVMHPQSEVMHTNFFHQAATKMELMKLLS